MDKQDVKNKELEKSLNQLGILAANATDELIKTNAATKSISDKLIQIQNKIEQIYIALEEPLDIADTK